MLARWEIVFYGASLLTLPWVGLGMLKIFTGRDWGGGLQPSWLFLALAILCAAAGRLRNESPAATESKRWPPNLGRWFLLGAGAVLASVLISVGGLWWAPSGETIDTTLGRFAKQVAQLIIMAAFAIYPACWIRGSRRWAWTIKLLLMGGILQVVYGFLQGVAYYQPLAAFTWLETVFTSNPSILSGSGQLYLGDSFHHVPRLRGTVCEPLYLGNNLLFLWPFLLVPIWSVRKRRLVAATFLVLMLMTWSRGAWLGLSGQVFLAVVLVYGMGIGSGLGVTRSEFRFFRKMAFGLVILTAAVSVVGWVAGWDGLLFPYRRLVQSFSGQDWSNLTRLYSMQAAWRGFLLSPVLGLGWGQFGWHFPVLVDPMGLQSQFTWPVVNNFPLLILCETGLIGFVVFLAWCVGLARVAGSRLSALRCAPLPGGKSVLYGRILLAAIVSAAGVLFQLLTFSQFNLPHIWVALGLLLAILADNQPGGPYSPEPLAKDPGT